MKRILLIALLVGLASPAWASYFKGNDLHKVCQSSSNEDVCSGYIMGIVDATAWTKADIAFCVPKDSSLRQATDIVTKWLNENPEHRHLSAAGLVITALTLAWPCPK
ncbi:MAG: hypothetical protein H8E36_00210 [Rhodospirillaceae bacterium]|nr:hypothetical protein [Rhodospirillaceae bacterium]